MAIPLKTPLPFKVVLKAAAKRDLYVNCLFYFVNRVFLTACFDLYQMDKFFCGLILGTLLSRVSSMVTCGAEVHLHACGIPWWGWVQASYPHKC